MGHGREREGGEKSVGGPMNAPAAEAEAHAKVSKRENRLYVGNLPYDCNYKDLEKFMSGGGFGLDFTSESLGIGTRAPRGPKGPTSYISRLTGTIGYGAQDGTE